MTDRPETNASATPSARQAFSPDTRFTPRADIIETDLDDELVLMEPESGKMFGLNVTGRFVWQALPGQTLEQVAGDLAEHFGISREEAFADSAELLATLCDAGLVRPDSAETSA